MKRWLVLCVAAVVLVAIATPTSPAGHKTGSLRAVDEWCSGAQTWQSASLSLGDPVRVRARVVRAYYAATTSGRPTFLDLGRAYPSRRRLTVVIWGRDRVNFPRAPERMFGRGTVICAQGVVTSYRGAAQIKVALWDPIARILTF
jgi:hypothetical protein